MSAERRTRLGCTVYLPPGDKRKRPIGEVTQADSMWLTMLGLAELWPDIVRALFPHQSTEVERVLDRWQAEGWGQRGVHELLFHPDSPHAAIVKRWRLNAPPPEAAPPVATPRPVGVRFLRGVTPVTLTLADLGRLRGLFPDVVRFELPEPGTVIVWLDYAVIGECMAARMGELPSRTLLYNLVWHGKWQALYSAMVPVDTTLRIAA